MSSPLPRFWDQFRVSAAACGERLYPHKPGKPWESYRQVGKRHRRIGDYVYHVGKGRFWVSFEPYTRKGDVTGSNRVFDLLKTHQSAIEERFGMRLDWDRRDNSHVAAISYRVDGAGYGDEEHWTNLHREMLTEMERLTAALEPVMEVVVLGNL